MALKPGLELIEANTQAIFYRTKREAYKSRMRPGPRLAGCADLGRPPRRAARPHT